MTFHDATKREHDATIRGKSVESVRQAFRTGAANWLGFDAMCRCGHEEGLHGPRGNCEAIDCGCYKFHPADPVR